MDQSKLKLLKKTTHTIVQHANRDGEIDAGLLTIGIARQRIARMMGLDENDLDEKPWKGQVKELVLAEMSHLEDVISGNSQTKKPINPTPSPTKPVKRTKNGKGKNEKEVVDEAVDEEEEEVPTSKGRKRKNVKKVLVDPDEEEEDVILRDKQDEEQAIKSSSESSLIDEGPSKSVHFKKRRKRDVDVEVRDIGSKKQKRKQSESVELDSGDEPSKKIKGKKSTKTTSKSISDGSEDPKVKELKAIVVACGVRKQWKKEFEGKDTPNQQITHLRQILSDLGMKGQPTKAKAVMIKEQRELAAELGDIKEFEKARGMGMVSDQKEEVSGRPKRSAAPTGTLALRTSEDEESDEDGEQGSEGENGESDYGHGRSSKVPRRAIKRVADSSDDDEGAIEDSEPASEAETAATSDYED